MVKGEVCKTSMQRFESARRLQFHSISLEIPNPRPLRTKRMFRFCSKLSGETALIASFNSSDAIFSFARVNPRDLRPTRAKSQNRTACQTRSRRLPMGAGKCNRPHAPS